MGGTGGGAGGGVGLEGGRITVLVNDDEVVPRACSAPAYQVDDEWGARAWQLRSRMSGR